MTATAMLPDRLLDADVHASGEVHRIWRWMRDHAPVHRHEAGQLPMFWSLTRYEDIRAAYRTPEVFSSLDGVLLRAVSRGDDPGRGLTLALTDPPRHRQLRAMLTDRFDERCARGLEDVIRAEARTVIADAAAAGECDFAHDVGARLAIYLICRLMGVAEGDYESMLRWTTEAFEAGTSLVVHPQFMRYFVGLMDARARQASDDAVSMLLGGFPGSGEPLTEAEVLLNCENLVGATENAGLSTAAGMQAFLEHPQQWRRLRERPGLLPTAVEEVLRWTSSATHSMRTATRPIEVQGVRIEAGDRVVLWIPSANRDGSVFADPDTFDVGRRPNRHLALGIGEHVCIGSTMARHQMRALFAELIADTADIEQVGSAVPLRSLAVSGPAHLPVRITMR